MHAVAIFAGFVAVASAIPLAHKPVRRDFTSMVTETIFTTVDIPVTLWVDESGNPIATSVVPPNFSTATTVVPTFVSLTTTVLSTSSSASPSSPAVPAPAPTTTLVTSAPALETTTVAPATTSTVAPPPPSTTSSAPTSAAQTPTNSPVVVAQAASGSTNAGAVSASATNMCTSESDACVGDITYYNGEGADGACGWPITDDMMEVALPHAFMGDASNSNPYCKRTITILNPTTGVSVQATVGDKCMGCDARAIDLTPAVFNAVGNNCNGRCPGFEWWLN